MTSCEGPGCGVEFAAKRATAKYCSDACRQRAYRERRPRPARVATWPKPSVGVLAACAVCSASFTARRGAKYCSDACRNRAPRAVKLTCADCDKPMSWGTTSLPQGQARCLDCRRAQATQSRWEPEPRACRTCARVFEPKQRRQVYCTWECRPKTSGSRRPHALSAAKRGYGHAHQKARAEWAVKVATGEVDCALCGDPIETGQSWDLDHDEDRTGYRGPAHARCNRREGGIRGNRSPRRRATPMVRVQLTAEQIAAIGMGRRLREAL